MRKNKLPAHKFDGAAIHLYSVSSEKQYIHSSFNRCLNNFRKLYAIDKDRVDLFLEIGMESRSNLARGLLRLLSHYMYFDNFLSHIKTKCLNIMTSLIMLGSGQLEREDYWYTSNYRSGVIERNLRKITTKEEINETTHKKDYVVVAAEEMRQAASDVQDGGMDVRESELRPL